MPKRCRDCGAPLIERLDACGYCLRRWLTGVAAFAFVALIFVLTLAFIGTHVGRRMPHQERTRHPAHGVIQQGVIRRS